MPLASVITNHPGFYCVLNVIISSSDTSLLWQCLGLTAQSSNLPPHSLQNYNLASELCTVFLCAHILVHAFDIS
jgi:hypothetical protein